MTLLKLSACGGACILAVLLARKLTPNAVPARLFRALWTLCALRLLIPAALPCRLSIWGLRQSAGAAQAVLRVPAAQQRAALPVGAVSGAQTGAAFAARSAFPWLTVLWAIGAAGLALFFLLGYLRALRALSRARQAPDAGIWLASCGIRFRRTISIRLLDDARTPLTYGLGRPVVVLPERLETDARRRMYILTHELVHIRSFDCLQKWLLTLALCVHWFNPLVWMMVYAANRDLELACDETVLRLLGDGSRKAYAGVLLEFAAQKRPELAFGSGFGQTAAEERIRHIMKYRKTSYCILLITVLALALSLTAFATQAPVQKEAPSPAAPAAASSDTTAEKPAQAQLTTVDNTSATQEDASIDEAQAADWTWPCEDRSAKVLMGFGSRKNPSTGKTAMHLGADLDVETGTQVLASHAGNVSFAGYTPDGGYRVIIDHEAGYQTVYQHLSSLSVGEGDIVEQGQLLGLSGESGWVTGPQLHVALLKDGEYLDPLLFMQR